MNETPYVYDDFFNAQAELQALITRALEAVLGAEGITMLQASTLKALKEQGGRAACPTLPPCGCTPRPR